MSDPSGAHVDGLHEICCIMYLILQELTNKGNAVGMSLAWQQCEVPRTTNSCNNSDGSRYETLVMWCDSGILCACLMEDDD
jgi:hypothetical protein